MKRREFLGLAAGAGTSWPFAARAQQAKRMLRVGAAGVSPRSSSYYVAFERRMAELGYREGDIFTFDHVQADDKNKTIDAAYREIAERKPDILLASGTEANLKSALATSETTPIVMLAVSYDPLALGYVASLARPGGRVTGLVLQQIELTRKRVQLLKEAIPDMTSAILFFDRYSGDQWKAAEDAGARLGVRLSGIDLRDPPYDYDRALAQAPTNNRANLLVPTSPRILADRERLAQFALRNRLASMFTYRPWVDAGGLMSYGQSIDGMFRQIADVVDQIARGAKPADLPIQQPTKFEFVINLSTARALGIELSPSLLARADEVIE